MDEYSLNYDFPVDKAGIDKFELTLGKWNINGLISSVFNFYEYLGDKPIHQLQGSSRAFSHHQLRDRDYKPTFSLKTLKLNNKQPVRPGRPLFSGALYARGNENTVLSEDDSHYSMNFKLALALNLNRFIRYQCLLPVHPHDNEGRIQYNLPEACEVIRPSGANQQPRTREIALDGGHNFLPRPGAYADNWGVALRRYIESTERYINTELDNFNLGTSGAGLDYQLTPEYMLSYLEVYWDLRSDSPLVRVPEIADRIREHFNNTSETLYPVTTSREHSSQTIKAKLQTGVTLSIYAKTNKRVRVEVSIEYKKCQQLRINNGTGSTVGNLNALSDGIARSVQYAHERLSELWTSIRELEGNAVSSPAGALDFVTLFYEQFSDNRRAGQLLQQLIANRGIPRRNLPKRDIYALTKLVRSDVLTYRGRPYSRFTIAPEYEAAYNLC